MPYPEAIEHLPESTQIFVKKVHNRIETGKNALILVTGETGGGKSYACILLSLAMYLYRHGKYPEVEKFNKNCTFKVKDFLIHLKNEMEKKKQIFIWEEGGVSANSRNWQSKVNKALSFLTQTFRSLQHIVFINLPCTNFLDKTVRQLLHYQLDARRIDQKSKICLLKPYQLQYNNSFGKMYTHGLSKVDEYGITDVNEIGCPLAPQEYLDAYEIKKEQYIGNLLVDMIEDLEQDEEKNKPKPKPIKYTENEQLYMACLAKEITDYKKIAFFVGCNPSMVYKLRDSIKKKQDMQQNA